MRLWDVLAPISRAERVDADRQYPLLGVRLDNRGAFLREVVGGSSSAATRLYRVRAGDFIYSRLFAWRGAFDVIDDELDGKYVSSEFPTFRPDPARLDVRFLRYWFQLPATLRRVLEDCTGSTPLTRNRFKEEFLLALVMPLPPLHEQRRILARIETVANALTRIEDLQSEVAALSDTTVVSLHHTFAAGAARHLRDLIELYEVAVDVESSASYPQVGVRSFGAGLFPKAATLGSSTTYKRFNTLYEGAIVLSQVKGWEGALALCPSELAGWFVSPEYRTFRCRDSEVLPEYIGRMIRTTWFWNKLQAATRGVGARRERTRPEQFLDIELTMPTVRDQQRALVVFERLQKVDSFRQSTQPQRAALLPAILDRAFKGEL